MKVLLVVGCIVLALLLISCIRVGGSVEFSADGLIIRARLGVLRFTVFPFPMRKKKKRQPKDKKEKRVKKQNEKPAEETKPGGMLSMMRSFLPLITEAAGRMKRKIRVDRIYLDLTVTASDPAEIAFAYGGVNAMIGMVWPLLEHNFNIKDRRIRTRVDFQAAAPTIYVFAALSLTIGQGVMMVTRLIIRFSRCTAAYRAEKQVEFK